MAIATISTNRIGIEMLLNFSIPFFTPRKTIKAVRDRNMNRHTIGPQTEEANSPNIPVTASALSGVKLNVADLTRYSMAHPPTTL